MNLSLCMIVRNESEPLPRCLASVRSLVDEMVIVDTGSTDETVAIAQSFGAQVFHAEWQDDFAAARNEALQHVNGKWVLVLDADEEIAPDSVPALRQIMQDDETLVVNLVRQEIGAVQSPYSMVSRLFRQHPDLQFAHPYHASIDDSVLHILQQEPQWRVVDLPDIAIL
ncbi:MAG TPA: glycosyltransferase family 2 protein, partial [Chroococcidiopsis sp.]